MILRCPETARLHRIEVLFSSFSGGTGVEHVDAFGTNEGTYSQGAITIVDRAQVLM